jgi:hypothetical protein
MANRLTIRLNVHAQAGSDRLSYALLLYTENARGVPTAHLVEHGASDLRDQDLVGIAAVVQALAVAVDQTA